MTQVVAATAVLGPGQTGLTLGYRVLNLDGTEYSAFTATGVAETSVSGTYRVADGVTVPDAGGYIVFGTAVLDLAEATVDAAAPTASANASQVRTELATELAYLTGPVALEATLTAIKGAGWTTQTLVAIVAAIGSGGITAQEVRDALKLAPTAGAPAAGSVDAELDAILEDTGTTLPAAIAAISAGAGSGTGTYTDTVTDGTNPLDGVRVQLSTDSAKANPVYQAYTNALGVFLFHPDPGAYYVWFEKAGYDFSAVNGTGVTVT